MRAVLLLLAILPAVHAQANDSWKKMDFLLGKWTGMARDKDTPLGPGEGAFSFEAELNRKIIVRRNDAHYSSGVQHEDLMVIYLDAPNDTPHAMYFDSEGHVIRYEVKFPAANRTVFESEAAQPGPRYRLTYWLEGAALNGSFEIAPPDSEYKTYLNWTSKRR